MPIIFVCSVPFGGGEKLARTLADKLGYAYLSREDVVAKANECGIPVGKLEVALLKKPAVRERLARLKGRYLAVATATIAEKAAAGDLVYFGRAGHLLLPDVSHVIRVRAIPDQEQRIENAAQRIKLTPEKAETFLDQIDSDIRAWVHFVHGVEMDDLRRYDFVVNLEHMSVSNAATALCGIADLPDFRPTPSSRNAMQERLLQARARIRLALDERTADADLTVRSSSGVVTITYMPRQAALAQVIPNVLQRLPDCTEIRCTVATTNVLWIQEEFRPDSETLGHVKELARRWGAAVELVRYRPEEDGDVSGEAAEPSAWAAPGAAPGGVEDDVVETISTSDQAFRDTLESLVHVGQSGGGQTVAGSRERLVAAVSPDIPYSLLVVGDVFLHRPSAVRTRLERELTRYIAGHVKTPVISASELRKRMGFSVKQAAGLAAALVLVAIVYWLLFGNQQTVLDVLGGPFHKQHSWVAPALVALVAPLVAGLYGMAAASLLKLIKLE